MLFPTSADRPLPSLHASASDPSAAIGKAGRPPNSPPSFPPSELAAFVPLPSPSPVFCLWRRLRREKEGGHSGLSHRQRLQPRLQATATNFPRSPLSPPFGTAAGQQTDSEEEEEEERVTLKTAAKEKRGAGKCIVF